MSRSKWMMMALAVMLVVGIVCPMHEGVGAQFGGSWYAGQKGRLGEIASSSTLVQGGYTPFHGPDNFTGCRAALRSRGLLRIDGVPW